MASPKPTAAAAPPFPPCDVTMTQKPWWDEEGAFPAENKPAPSLALPNLPSSPANGDGEAGVA